jgi:flagellar hook-associated protein 1 FlgK
LDAIARDLIDRFADPAVDPSLTPGDAGLFTDAGSAFLPANEVGISARLTINPAVDPMQGGEAWRIRDGVGAAAPGAAGDSSLLRSFADALSDNRVPASGSFGSGALSLNGILSSLLSQTGSDLLTAENQVAFTSAHLDELEQNVLEDGVDSDAELQRLILIEQAYAANARIIQTADEMLATLMRI